MTRFIINENDTENKKMTPQVALGPWQRTWRAFWHHRPGVIGAVIVIGFLLLALMWPLFVPHDPLDQDLAKKFLPPFWQEGGLKSYFLGTDLLGRDVFSRILAGSRLSLMIGVISVAVGSFAGIPLGLIAGFRGHRIDAFIMRSMDIWLAFPSTLLAICIVAILGPSLTNAMIAIGLVSVPLYARMVRAAVLSEREREYVTAAIALGQTQTSILAKSILPNVIGPIMVLASLGFASAVLEGAALSFIGLGAEPPLPEWGALLFEGKQNYYQAPWLIIYPGVAIFITVIGFNLLGDGLRDAMDPKRQKR